MQLTEQNGELVGPFREPRNSAINAGAGSIHDDSTAKKLGFRGGTVAGSLHMEQFPPLLEASLGQRWHSTGSMSLYFRYATTDGEEVQAKVAQSQSTDGDQQIDVSMDDTHGHRVCDGTASVGAPDMDSAVRRRIANVAAPNDIRILEQLSVGDRGSAVPTRVTNDQLEQRLAVVTESMPAYTDASIWGERVITPALQVRIMRPGEQEILKRGSDFGVGLFGAIELQALNGPVFVEHDYETWSEVLAIGETPKTEYFYYRSMLCDTNNGNEVMSMLMMLRFMKGSSALWQ